MAEEYVKPDGNFYMDYPYLVEGNTPVFFLKSHETPDYFLVNRYENLADTLLAEYPDCFYSKEIDTENVPYHTYSAVMRIKTQRSINVLGRDVSFTQIYCGRHRKYLPRSKVLMLKPDFLVSDQYESKIRQIMNTSQGVKSNLDSIYDSYGKTLDSYIAVLIIKCMSYIDKDICLYCINNNPGFLEVHGFVKSVIQNVNCLANSVDTYTLKQVHSPVLPTHRAHLLEKIGIKGGLRFNDKKKLEEYRRVFSDLAKKY